MHLKFKRYNRGSAMLEIMAATAVASIILAAALNAQMKASDQTTGRGKADTLSNFQQLTQQYFIANRIAIEAAMGGDAAAAAAQCMINVAVVGSGGTTTTNATKHTCTFDTTFLRSKGLWPSGVPVDSPEGRYVAIARQVLSAGVPTGADEVLIVLAPVRNGNIVTSGTIPFSGEAKRALEEIQAGMETLGGAGGFIPPGKDTGGCQYNATTQQVCGSDWAVNLSDFID